MPQFFVDNLADDRLTPFRNLKQSNATRDAHLFVAEGLWLVQRVLASRYPVRSILLDERHAASLEIPADVETLIVPDAMIEQIVGFNFHRGVLASAQRLPSPTLRETLQPLVHRQGTRRQTIVICPDVQSPENLGSILRISSALGVDAVLLGPGSADPFSRRVLRVSMGTGLRLPIVVCNDLGPAVESLRREWSFELVASCLAADAEPLHSFRRGERTAIFFGSEAAGLSERWLTLCDKRLTIEMAAGVDSLNVAVAAGIFLHQLQRAS